MFMFWLIRHSNTEVCGFMKLVNIHCHMLYGVDDGAADEKMMQRMLDISYRSGVRTVCMTPHHNPRYFHSVPERIADSYERAVRYAREKYPDMTLFLGQELYCCHDSVADLINGKCLTLNKTRNVLLEFDPYADGNEIIGGASRLLASGFIPLIAHIERYSAITAKPELIKKLRALGAGIQVNAAAVMGKYGFFEKHYVLHLIKKGLVDVIADDCHDVTDKPPCLAEAYNAVCRKFGEDVAIKLFVRTPLSILGQ